MLILTDSRENGNSDVFLHAGGPLQVQVIGLVDGTPSDTLNGITVQVQARQDGLQWRNLDNGRFTTPDLLILDAKANTEFRVVVSGQTSNNGTTVSFI